MKLSKEKEYSFGSDLSFTVSLKVKMQVAVSLSKGSWKGTNQRLKKRGIKMSLLNTKESFRTFWRYQINFVESL